MGIVNALPPLELFLPFLFAGLALNLTPGPDMAFVALSGARGGRRTGIAAAAGIFVGCFVHILFATIGLSALIAASQSAFLIIKWMGVIYLVYLAYQLIRVGPVSSNSSASMRVLSPSNAFRQAAAINLLNPKVGIFFLAFLPQFVEPDIVTPWQQILALGLVFNATGAIVNVCVAVVSAGVFRRLGSSQMLHRAARWIAATVLGGLAVKLALSRSP